MWRVSGALGRGLATLGKQHVSGLLKREFTQKKKKNSFTNLTPQS